MFTWEGRGPATRVRNTQPRRKVAGDVGTAEGRRALEGGATHRHERDEALPSGLFKHGVVLADHVDGVVSRHRAPPQASMPSHVARHHRPLLK